MNVATKIERMSFMCDSSYRTARNAARGAHGLPTTYRVCVPSSLDRAMRPSSPGETDTVFVGESPTHNAAMDNSGPAGGQNFERRGETVENLRTHRPGLGVPVSRVAQQAACTSAWHIALSSPATA